jgi:hypothetical protein
MGKKNNSYTASYKLKALSFAEQFGNRAAQRELGILESKMRYWRKQKELLKMQRVTIGHFVGRKLKKFEYFTSPLMVIFCNSPNLSRPIRLHLFNVIDSATFHCFLQVQGTRRSGKEHGQVCREGVGGTECCVSPEIHLW